MQGGEQRHRPDQRLDVQFFHAPETVIEFLEGHCAACSSGGSEGQTSKGHSYSYKTGVTHREQVRQEGKQPEMVVRSGDGGAGREGGERTEAVTAGRTFIDIDAVIKVPV